MGEIRAAIEADAFEAFVARLGCCAAGEREDDSRFVLECAPFDLTSEIE